MAIDDERRICESDAWGQKPIALVNLSAATCGITQRRVFMKCTAIAYGLPVPLFTQIPALPNSIPLPSLNPLALLI